MSQRDLLIAVATVLEAGWCQGEEYIVRDDGGVDHCINGAIDAVACRQFPSDIIPAADFFAVAEPLYRAIAQQLPPDGQGHLESWNDAPDRTKDEVIALVRRAVEAAS